MMAIQMMKMMIQMLMTRKSKYSVTAITILYRLSMAILKIHLHILNERFFTELNVMKLETMKNLIQTWKIYRYRDHFHKTPMTPHFENLNREEYENCKYSY